VAIDENVPTTLLLGGGYTLEHVAERLSPNSFVITSRNPDRIKEFHAKGWAAEHVDVEDIETLKRCLVKFKRISGVIDSIPTSKDGGGTKYIPEMIAAFKDAKVEKVVYLSTTGVYGVRDGSWVNESTPTEPWSPPGKARLACENLYRASSLRSVSLRLPAIVGPGRNTADSLRSGRYRLVGDGSKWTNRIHVDDLANIVIAALLTNEAPAILSVSDDTPVQARELVTFLCEKLSLPFPSSVSERELEEQGAFTMLSNQRVSNTTMKSVLGISLVYPSFRWMVEEGVK
jgi:hypothetical protein